MFSGRYWMDNVLCDGNETEISQCRFNGWGDNDCEASEAAGIICHNPNEKPDLIRKNRKKRPKLKFGSKYEMEIRLTGGRNPNEGQVEVGFVFLCVSLLRYMYFSPCFHPLTAQHRSPSSTHKQKYP